MISLFAPRGWTLILCLGLCVMQPAQAETLSKSAAEKWLLRVAAASEKRNYTGVYTYQYAGQLENYRIAHVYDNKGVAEKREALDGPPKLLVRLDDNITLYLPDKIMPNLTRKSVTKLFPSILPEKPLDLLDNYRLQNMGTERIAGIEAQQIQFIPLDKFRHSYRLWVDPRSDLLVKAGMYDAKGSMIEQFTFTQFSVLDKLDRQSLALPNAVQQFAKTKTQTAKAQLLLNASDDWELKGVPEGFDLVSQNKRLLKGKKDQTVTHFVFSDGLSSVSVFLAPLTEEQAILPRLNQKSQTRMAEKRAADFEITVIGDVPEATVTQILNSITPRKKPQK